MLTKRTAARALSVFTLVLIASAPFAESAARPRGGPPPEAIEACAEKAENDACSFTGPRGDLIEGSCLAPPRGEEDFLACAPQGGRRPPPPPRH